MYETLSRPDVKRQLQEAQASNRAEHQVDAGRDGTAEDIADLVLCRRADSSTTRNANPIETAKITRWI